MPPPLALVVGLGNPGSRYEQTRHNAGFWFVDALADRASATFRPNARFLGDVCELSIGDQRLRLLKPTTFMNRSGQAVAALARFYRHSVEEILVVHDEIDLPVGSVRLKRGGGHGGHNGLRDIVAHMGSADFARVRIGVGHPGNSDDVIDYVLQRASAADEIAITESIERVLKEFAQIASGNLERVMNQLHKKPKPPKSEQSDDSNRDGASPEESKS